MFISVEKTIECIVAALIFSAAFSATYYKLLGILQSSGYSGKRLMSWAAKKNNQALIRQSLLFMLCALSYAVVALCFSFTGEWAAVIALLPCILFFVLYTVADKKIALRVPLSATPRLKRLYVLLFFITSVCVYLAVTLLNLVDHLWQNGIFAILRYLPLALFPLLTLPLIALSNLVAKIYEVPHNNSFIKKAKSKLASARITVVAVTGSYGKTSTKNFLSKILSARYRVLSTPRSHNTPLGVAKTVNDNNLEDYDILIVEMGARHVGDIGQLCEICPPDYSVITGICPQHLESFGSVENIVKAKGEILEHTKNSAVIADDCFDMFAAYPCTKYRPDCLSNVSCNCTGTEFALSFGSESLKVKCKLLGRHSAENIALAARLSYMLGLSPTEIRAAIEELDFIEHRLQLIQSNGVNILDDGYNSNVRGAAAALDVLRSFGGRKIVVTPGLVELGILEESENYALGKNLAGLDKIILVGDTLVLPVKQGYLDGGGDPEKISTVPTLAKAQEQLKSYLSAGDTVLFLNDLPDIYR